MGGRPAGYSFALTTGVTIHRELSPAAKLYLAAAAALLGHDPGVRRLETVLRLRDQTLSAAERELERAGLARLTRRKGKRTIVEPCGLAVPFDKGRHRYAILPAPLVRRARDAAIDPLGLLVLQRLCRQQSARGAAQVPADVLGADLAIAPATARKLLRDLHAAGLIERHKGHPLDSDDAPILTVPLADGRYRIDVGRLDPDRTRVLEHVKIGEHELIVLAARSDVARIATRLAELRAHNPEAAEAAAATLAAGNLTGAVVLGEDLLATLAGTTLPRVWDDTHTPFGTTLPAVWDDTSKDLALAVEKRYADDDEQDGQLAHAGAAAPAGAEELSSEEERVHRAPPHPTRADVQRFEAPYCPIVGYTATAATHERIAALLHAVAVANGDGEAREAVYQAVVFATGEWAGGASGANVLRYLQRRFKGHDPERSADAGLDFGTFGEAAA